MGQKINPLGFRLGTSQGHHSLWFEQPKNYSEGLQEDQKIRNFIKNYVQKNIKNFSDVEGIARIEIQKGVRLFEVIIYIGFPKYLTELIEGKPKRLQELQRNLQKEFSYVTQKINIAIPSILNPYRHPNILAEFIAKQLKNRVSFRKAMKQAIELTKKGDPKGIQIKIRGRLGGNEMARAYWIRKGRVPLQTIQAKIDYCSYTIQTVHGVLGIKIWIFVDEE